MKPCIICGGEPVCWGHANDKTVAYRMECVGMPEISIRDLLLENAIRTEGGFHMLATDFFNTREEAEAQWDELFGENEEDAE